MYLTDLHVHSAPVSHCGSVEARDVVAVYRAAGYDGIVLSNHLNNYTFHEKEDWSWEDKIRYFLKDYEAAREAGGKDFNVLLGCEVNLTEEGAAKYIPNDYLIYGVTADWLLHSGDLRRMKLQHLHDMVKEAGFLLVHAHPFRPGTQMSKPEYLDGVEIYNGNARHDSSNDLAAFWAQKRHLIPTSGSDYHRMDDPTVGGIYTAHAIRDNETLLKTLREGAYQPIFRG